MRNEGKVYKARVTKVSVPMEDGKTQREIYISPLDSDGGGVWEKSASPPSPLPTSVVGSGMLSYPSVGQECLVAEFTGARHIIGYTQPRGFAPYGQLPPDVLDEGSFQLSVNGIENAKLLLTRKGFAGLISNEFAKVYIDGTDKVFLAKSRTSKIEYAGGQRHDLYDKENEHTQSRHVYTKIKDIRGFSDAAKRLEQGNSVPLPPTTPQYDYADKLVYNYGHIPGENIVYHRKTMQSQNPINRYDKTVVTSHRIGYQTEHERHNGIEYPEGTIFETSYKKNIRNNVGTMLERYGQLKQGEQAGEIYRKQLYEGLNRGVPYGNPLRDPLGEGLGYDYSLNSDSAYQFVESFGELSDSTLYRRAIHKKALTSGKLEYKTLETIGGDSIHYYLAENEENKLTTTLGSPDVSFIRQIERHSTGIFTEQVFNSEAALATRIETDSYEYKHTVNKGYLIDYTEGNDTEIIEVKRKKLSLKSSDDVEITIDGEKITLKVTDASILELTPDGMKYNGQSLAFGQLVTLLKQNGNRAVISSSPGSPAPLFPALLTNLQANEKWKPNSGNSLTTEK